MLRVVMSEEKHNSNDLIQLCMARDWEAAFERVGSHPQEARFGSMRACESALHYAAVGNAPVHLLQAIATAGGPRLVTKVHVGHAMGVPIDCLLASCPLSSMTPDLKDKVLAILEANPVAGAELSIQTAFHLIQRHVKRALQTYPQTFPSSAADGTFVFIEEEECRQGVQIIWDVFVLLVKVAYYKTMDIPLDSLPLLHALVDYSKPLYCWEHGLLRKRRAIGGKAIQFAARLLPHELLLTDPMSDSGDLPLHLAISKTNPDGMSHARHDRYNSRNIRSILHACPKAADVTNHRGLLPLELSLLVGQSWDNVSDILDASTGAVNATTGCNIMHMIAASTRLWDYSYNNDFADVHHKLLQVQNHAGLLSLHVAIHQGMPWHGGMELLYEAFPGAITQPDTNGLYPFLLAVVRATEQQAFNPSNRNMNVCNRYDHGDGIEVTFHLLRAWPDALKLVR
jgi:hypothetical protein